MDASQTVKSVVNLNNMAKFALGFILLNAILELTGLSDYFYYPVSTIKSKFQK